MRYADAGYNLEIDLTRGNIEKVENDPRDTELYLGGLGTSAKIIWDRVPPETDAFAPENVLIFSAGLLCGTPTTSANRTIVTSISPQTKLFQYSMMGGFWAPELKLAGYDKVIMRGKAPNLVYIWINNDKVEIRDASHLQGKGAVETQELIKKELKEPKAQVAAIGLAGESKVFFASIEQARSSCSRGGMGAVMGSKNVKAIAVRGTKDIYIAKPVEYINLMNEVLEYTKWRNDNPIPNYMPILAGLGSPQEMKHDDEKWHTESFSWGNSRARRRNFWTEEIAEEWKATMASMQNRTISCFNCPNNCGATLTPPGKPTYMMKCFTKLTYTMAAYSDLAFGLSIAQMATEYGIDGYSGPQVMAFGLELLEAGILTQEDFPGMPDDNDGKFYWLLDKIVRREGIGDILADGTYWAAERIGKGADAFAHNNIRKHEQLPLKLGTMDPIYYLLYCCNEKMTVTQIEGNFPQAPFPTQEEKEAFVSDWFQCPSERIKDVVLKWSFKGEYAAPYYPSPEMCSEIVDWQERMHYVDDCVGMCAGMSAFPLKPPYHLFNYPQIISAASGIEMDTDELVKVTTRVRNLVRANNIIRGLRRVDEVPPADHWGKRFPELEKELLDTYYKYKGWNNDGVPTKEFLHELNLDFVAEEFEKRGIYSEIPSYELAAQKEQEV